MASKYLRNGDHKARYWILRFEDHHWRDQFWDGETLGDEEAEKQARAAWEQYSPDYTCHLMATVRYYDDDVDKMRGALQEIGAHMCDGNRYRNMRAFPVMKDLVLKAANIANRALGYREIRFDDFESRD